MSAPAIDVVTLGNAIVDIIGRCDDAYLARHGCAKGSMRLVDEAALMALYDGMGPGVEISGGSAANTAVGVAAFGGKAAFIGKIAADDFGKVFAHDVKAAGVAFSNAPVQRRAGQSGTSRSLILVTPDGERTMNTLLDISTEFTVADIQPAMVEGAKVTYLEGYLFDPPEAKAAFRHAAGLAKRAGRQVALSLSDAFCVDRHRDEFLSFIRSDVDILFANESEITSLFQVSSFDAALAKAVGLAPVMALTRSAKGSVILARGATPVMVAAAPVAKVVDTTGAGDLYAAGFLYGLTNGRDHARAAALGSLAAAEVISHVGARPEASLADLARRSGL
ncbi:MAG: adenosine kinase [Hyphomicrobiales bacterium]|nr:adenosine kinase [Hyphomicrobiales bacterium]